MINMSFDDPNFLENFEAAEYLRRNSSFTDEEIQKMLDSQIEKDKEVKKEGEFK